VHLNDLGAVKPKVYDSRTATKLKRHAVVAQVAWPEDKLAEVEIVNLFDPDEGDLLQFPESGFEVTDCLLNGEKVNFASYVRQRRLEHCKLPLVGDCAPSPWLRRPCSPAGAAACASLDPARVTSSDRPCGLIPREQTHAHICRADGSWRTARLALVNSFHELFFRQLPRQPGPPSLDARRPGITGVGTGGWLGGRWAHGQRAAAAR
jgi:hypothetical protein